MTGIKRKSRVKHRLVPQYGVGTVERIWPDEKRADVIFKEYNNLFKSSMPNAGKGHFLISNLEEVTDE